MGLKKITMTRFDMSNISPMIQLPPIRWRQPNAEDFALAESRYVELFNDAKTAALDMAKLLEANTFGDV